MIRPAKPSDQSFIASTWVRSSTGVANRRYGKAGKDLAGMIDTVLDRSDTRALVRHGPGDPDLIYAWIVFAEGAGIPIVHYVYVRKAVFGARGNKIDLRGKSLDSELLLSIGVRDEDHLIYTCRGGEGNRTLRQYKRAMYLALETFLAPVKGKAA